MLGGWQIADITRYNTGIPFSAYLGLDQAYAGNTSYTGFGQRANIVGNPSLSHGRSHARQAAEYFNTLAFKLPAIGTFGNSRRNILTAPGFSQTDASLQKAFKLPREFGAFKFRSDFFNLFNHTQFGTPQNLLVSPVFGAILNTQAPARIIQLSLRYDF